MNILKYSTPIILWILCYFAWSYSAQFVITDEITVKGFWWLITDIMLAMGAIFSAIDASLGKY